MYDTISTANMPHEKWLALRKTGIGGSDAGAICGLNPYSSAIHVYGLRFRQFLPCGVKLHFLPEGMKAILSVQ